MSAFDYLPKKGRMTLVHYVQSLGDVQYLGKPAVNEFPVTGACSGRRSNSEQNTVSMAMAKLERESRLRGLRFERRSEPRRCS